MKLCQCDYIFVKYYFNPITTMCGNFSQNSKAEIIAKKYGIKKEILFEPQSDLYPWYEASVVGMGKDGPGLTKMQWSLIPNWFSGSLKDAKRKFKFNFNAIGEELNDKASYKVPYQKGQRCIIFTDRFSEPFGKKVDTYDFTLREDHALMSIAGLWNQWKDNESKAYYTFTMVTSQANALVAEVHSKKRMPLVLDDEAAELWMNPQSPTKVCDALVKPFSDSLMIRTKAN